MQIRFTFSISGILQSHSNVVCLGAIQKQLALQVHSLHFAGGQDVALLGEDILKDGRLDRGIVASRIFGNKELLAQVESFVHPAVLADFERWKENICRDENNTPDFVIFESAILLETPLVKSCADKIMTVVAPYELRIERVIKRDNASREQIEARIAKQWSDEQREALSDFIIFADSKQALLPQIACVIQKMKEFRDGNR